MNNLWEVDINNPSQCLANKHDEPYTMPYKSEGILSLTFDMFARTGLTGIAFDTKLYRTELDGTVIEDLGGINTYNHKCIILGDPVTGRYDITVPSPCGKGSSAFASIYQSSIVKGVLGATVQATIGTIGSNPYTVEWEIGQPAPHPVYQIGPTVYVINDRYQGTVFGLGLSYVDYLSKPTKTTIPSCHRYKLTIDQGGTLYEFYTVPFNCDFCNDGVVELDAVSPKGTIDCEGQKQSDSYAYGSTPAIDGMLNYRLCIYGYTKQKPTKMSLNYSSNCYHHSSSKIDRYNLYGRAIPNWLRIDMLTMLMCQAFYVNNQNLMIDSENFTEEQDIDLTDFQNINLALRTCDCEINFVC